MGVDVYVGCMWGLCGCMDRMWVYGKVYITGCVVQRPDKICLVPSAACMFTLVNKLCAGGRYAPYFCSSAGIYAYMYKRTLAGPMCKSSLFEPTFVVKTPSVCRQFFHFCLFDGAAVHQRQHAGHFDISSGVPNPCVSQILGPNSNDQIRHDWHCAGSSTCRRCDTRTRQLATMNSRGWWLGARRAHRHVSARPSPHRHVSARPSPGSIF